MFILMPITVKEKIILTFVKRVREILLRTIAVRKRVLKSKYNKDHWGFIAKEQDEEVTS